MRVAAYYPIHYGADYLKASITSIYPYVDKIFFLYSEKPSFGFNTNDKCPDNEDDLKRIAMTFDKSEWIRVSAGAEGQHRNYAFDLAKDYDLLLAVDADEVWEQSYLNVCLINAFAHEAHRFNISGFINFWKSKKHYCVDWFEPARIFNLKNKNEQQYTLTGKVYHFGCAMRDEVMRYKYKIHGHKSEIRANWLDEIYFNWNENTRYLHPTSMAIWEKALEFNENLPDYLI